MPHKLSSAAIEALKSSLQSVEENSGLEPGDSALRELKRVLVGRVAELEAAEQVSQSENRVAAVLQASPTPGDAAATLALDLAVSLVAQRPSMQTPDPKKAGDAPSESEIPQPDRKAEGGS